MSCQMLCRLPAVQRTVHGVRAVATSTARGSRLRKARSPGRRTPATPECRRISAASPIGPASVLPFEEVMLMCAAGEKVAAKALRGEEVEDKVEAVLSMYAAHGHQNVEADISHSQDPTRPSPLVLALRCAEAAKLAGADDETVVVALLHNVGSILDYMIPHIGWRPDNALRQGRLASNWLRQIGFSDRVVAAIAHQTSACRYLCFKDSDYYDRLSEHDKAMVMLHGGPMTQVAADVFESVDDIELVLAVRKYCDEASSGQVDTPVRSMGHHRDLIAAHLSRQMWGQHEAVPMFVPEMAMPKI